MKRLVCDSLEALSACAASFLEGLEVFPDRATVVGLSGELGAGKTAFVKALAVHLGISEHITSPTFVIQKTYSISESLVSSLKSLVHIDAYRLESGKELTKLNWEETLRMPQTLVVVEWPEKVEGVMPARAYRLLFETVNDTTRAITFV